MSRKMRIGLPMVNTIIAGVLLYLGLWRLKQPSPLFESREILLCQWINVPAVLGHKLVMSLWSRLVVAHLSLSTFERIDHPAKIADVLIFLSLVAVTWYVVGLELEPKKDGKSRIVPSSIWGRVIVDGVIILLGIVLVLSEIEHWTRDYFSAWIVLRSTLHLFWASTFIIFYGRDLLRSFTKFPR